MKKLIVALLVLVALTRAEAKQVLTARVTYYHRFGDGFGSKIAMPKKLKEKLKIFRSTEGKTVAAHSRFPFGTKVIIPDLKGVSGKTLTVVDRGTAVESKKAARGKNFVFDVYVEADSKREGEAKILAMSRMNPEYLKVVVY